MFKQRDIQLPKITQKNLPEGRRYVSEDGKAYPSVTTVLSKTKDMTHLNEWKKSVGEEEANRIMTHAAKQGTAVHDAIESYVLNQSYPCDLMPMQLQMVKGLREVADNHISEVLTTEAALMSDHLQTAGMVDCVCVFDGKVSILDWKTSRKPKIRDWIHDYFMQESFYAVAFEEMTGIPVAQLVTVMACETGETLIFKEKRDDWIGEFIKRRSQFVQ